MSFDYWRVGVAGEDWVLQVESLDLSLLGSRILTCGSGPSRAAVGPVGSRAVFPLAVVVPPRLVALAYAQLSSTTKKKRCKAKVIATRIIENTGGFAGVSHTYRLSEPLDGHEFVTVFAVDFPGTQHDETVIVGAREDGSAYLMNRLPGSLVGWADHEKALQLAGYSLGEDDLPAPADPEIEE